MKRDYETIELIKKFGLCHKQTLSGRGPYLMAAQILATLGHKKPPDVGYERFVKEHLKLIRATVKAGPPKKVKKPKEAAELVSHQ